MHKHQICYRFYTITPRTSPSIQLQSAAYIPDPTTVEGSCLEQLETLVLQEVQLPEVRSGVVNSYPCDYECWGTPPPRVGDGMEVREPHPSLNMKRSQN